MAPPRRLLCVLLLAAALCCVFGASPDLSPFKYNPLANAAAVVISSDQMSRFTVLAPEIIRIEYAKSAGVFEDRATTGVVNRNTAVPRFTQAVTNGWLIITTDALQLSYKVGSPFAADTLLINSTIAGSAFKTWYYGQYPEGNLFGTIKSLDLLGVVPLNCTQIAHLRVHDESLHCQWGMVSQDGWAAFDESASPFLDSSDWPNPPASKVTVDTYFLGYGHNYIGAISGYMSIGGRVAMVPRYVTGIMWTRWYDLTSLDVRTMIDDYTTRQIPLDVFILDMDWHTKWQWGGYTWDPSLFPNPSYTLGTIKTDYGLHFAANVHDDNGVIALESRNQAMCVALGEPATCGNIPFGIANSTWARALEDVVLQPVEQDGMDFWWIDWQQGGTQGGCLGNAHNPTILLNHLRSTDPYRRNQNERGLVLARWGGLGNHRYQVGFSGDVASVTWENLAFQPYFSVTGSNVLYGFWSHDIVGPPDDHELHTRWIQWGAFSAIFRTHDRGMSGGECANLGLCDIVELWNVPQAFYDANRLAVRARIALVPYTYTQHRVAYDTGLSPLRPMYYYWPEAEFAYATNQNGTFTQYMLGDSLLVAPVVSPMGNNSQVATQLIWLPVGVWVELNSFNVYNIESQAGEIMQLQYALDEVPVFAKGGSCVARLALDTLPAAFTVTTGLAMQQYTNLEWTIYPTTPGSLTQSGNGSVYEDDGSTLGYLNGQFSYHNINYTWDLSAPNSPLTINLWNVGSFPGFLSSRNIVIKLPNTPPVVGAAVSLDGVKKMSLKGMHGIPRNVASVSGYAYDAEELSALIYLANVPTTGVTTVTVTWGALTPSKINVAMNGLVGALQRSVKAKLYLDRARIDVGSQMPVGGQLASFAGSPEMLNYYASVSNTEAFGNLINSLSELYYLAVAEVEGMVEFAPPTIISLFDNGRWDNVLCLTEGCTSANYRNSGYRPTRVEGYQPLSSDPNAIPVYDYWSATANDNWVTTNATTPAGYEPAIFGNGFILSKQMPGTRPLGLYYSAQYQDHFTTSLASGVAWAQQYGYQFLGTLGYIYCNPPDTVKPKKRLFDTPQYNQTRVMGALSLITTMQALGISPSLTCPL